MMCEQVRRELSTLPQEKLSPWAAWRVERHLTRCADCRAAQTWMQRLETQARQWREVAPSAALQERIAAALAQSSKPPSASIWSYHQGLLAGFWGGRRMKRSLSAAFVALLIGVCLMVSLRGNPASAAMQRMEAAVRHVRNAHMITWWRVGQHQEGPFRQVEDLWYQDGCWRKTADEQNGGDRIIARGTYYKYDARQGKVISMRETGRQLTDFSLETLAGDYFPAGANTQVSTLGTTHEGERVIREVLVNMPGAGERMLFALDERTDLPVWAEKQVWTRSRWETIGRLTFGFNQTLPASLFDPRTLHEARAPAFSLRR